MKKFITLVCLSLSVMGTNVCQAAFPIKQEATATTTTAASQQSGSVTATNPEVQQTTKAVHTKKASRASSAVMPAILYVILAILGFGWLAMGINDNFGDFDWIISLILYILFYIPGLIYTLVKMGKYY